MKAFALRSVIVFAVFGCSSHAFAQSAMSFPTGKIETIGQSNFVATASQQVIDGPFSVKLTDASGAPVAGVAVEFSTNAYFCFNSQPNCVDTPGGYFGSFDQPIVTAETDADGIAVAEHFTAGIFAGGYDIIAMLSQSTGKKEAQFLGSTPSAMVSFHVIQSFNSMFVAISPATSGSWFNSDTSGQGFNFEVLENGNMVTYFYTFSPTGSPVFLTGMGPIQGVNFLATLYEVEGGVFPPHFDATKVVTSEWGQLQVSFSDCDNGVATWTPTVASAKGYTAGSMPIQRITRIAGPICNNNILPP